MKETLKPLLFLSKEEAFRALSEVLDEKHLKEVEFLLQSKNEILILGTRTANQKLILAIGKAMEDFHLLLPPHKIQEEITFSPYKAPAYKSNILFCLADLFGNEEELTRALEEKDKKIREELPEKLRQELDDILLISANHENGIFTLRCLSTATRPPFFFEDTYLAAKDDDNFIVVPEPMTHIYVDKEIKAEDVIATFVERNELETIYLLNKTIKLGLTPKEMIALKRMLLPEENISIGEALFKKVKILKTLVEQKKEVFFTAFLL